MANVNIKFNNKDYLLSCDDGQEESLKKLTKFLDKKYNELNFAKQISKSSKVQVVIIRDENDLRKFFVKNLFQNEIIICMGAGSISKWIREMEL